MEESNNKKIKRDLDDSPLIGYGPSIKDACDNLNKALMFHYNRGLQPCDHGVSPSFHFIDSNDNCWHIDLQKGKVGVIKAFLTEREGSNCSKCNWSVTCKCDKK